MFALLTVTFSGLKGVALAVAIVNAVVLAAVLICLLFVREKQEKQSEKKARSFFDAPANPNRTSDKTK